MKFNLKDHGQFDEKFILKALYREYQGICLTYKLKLRPVSLILFDSHARWGEFNSLTRTISISKRLITSHPWYKVIAVLKHEMAHQMVFESGADMMSPDGAGAHDQVTRFADGIAQGEGAKSNGKGANHHEGAHGEAFQAACRKLGLPAQYARARFGLTDSPLDSREDFKDEATEKILEKSKKLMALANSTNEYEAQLAVKRVRGLYAKHNLQEYECVKKSDYVHSVICLKKKKLTAWEHRTLSILIEHFFVKALTFQQFDVQQNQYVQAIEIMGTPANVELAEYVYYFLLDQVEYLLNQAQQSGVEIRGSGKRSFRLGVLDGFDEQLRQAAKVCPLTQSALVKFRGDPQLDKYMRVMHPHLRSRSSGGSLVDTEAFQTGHQLGQSLQLRRPMKSSAKKSGLLLE